MSTQAGARRSWTITVTPADAGQAINILATHTGISKSRLKQAMLKGAVRVRRKSNRYRHLRRATTSLDTGDIITIHYDPEILDQVPPQAQKLWSCREYSLWYKPAGLLAQGNEYGDHVSLLRQAELSDPKRKPVYLVHRLDREASGLMLIAHTRSAAGRLSTLFQQQQAHKEYEVRVRGRPPAQGSIDTALDGKPAQSCYERLDYDAETDTSLLRVWIMTGRTHQIRRHLEGIGHPVMGDPRYGHDNKNRDGLQLKATRLEFDCPLTREHRDFVLAGLLVTA